MRKGNNDGLPPRPGASRPPRHQGASANNNNNRGAAASASGEPNGTTTSTTSKLAPLPPLPAHLRGNASSSPANERTQLLANMSTTTQQSRQPPLPRRRGSFLSNVNCCSVGCFSATGVIVMSLAIFIGTYLASSSDDDKTNILERWIRGKHGDPKPPPYYEFGNNFTWGVATSSFQIEGATTADGRGASIWDVYCDDDGGHHIVDGSDGSVACDHYHRVKQDVALMASLNVRAYRFSIAWPRILPAGTGPVNPAGLRFYNVLIDTLLQYNIDPWVTLYHWDLPQALMENGQRGWMDVNTSYAFAEYAAICFDAFGDRVKHWITLNEAWTVAVNGYGTGIHAPGHQSTTELNLVGHNLLIGHGLAVQAFRKYQNRTFSTSNSSTTTTTTSMIGIANCGDFRYPLTVADNATAERVMLFQIGWFTEPLFFGDYPDVMRQRLGSRLPSFTAEQRALLVGSVDFVGLNYYSALQASTPATPSAYPGYWTTDINARLQPHPDWRLNDMGWAVVPDGLRNMLVWLSNRYNHPLLYITENGDAEHRDVTKPLLDSFRQEYLQGHLRAAGQAMERGVRLGGYFAWTFMDNFEWQYGYTKKFGLVKVDFVGGTLKRTPKASAYWYNQTIADQGKNIPRQPPLSWFPSV